LGIEVKVLTFNLAKKCGYISSAYYFIAPIVAFLMVIALIYQAVSPPIGEISPFTLGAITGYYVTMIIVSIIAFILFLTSMYKLSKYYNEPKIFKNILYSFLISILITSITLGILMYLTTSIVPHLPANPTPATIDVYVEQLLMSGIAILSISFICLIINGFFYWQAFSKLGEKSGVDSFKTAGTLYIIGTALCIVGVGAILIWISWLFAANGYRRLQPQTTSSAIDYTASTTAAYSTTSDTISGKIYCSYCGTESITDNSSTYCSHCGKPLHTEQTNT